MGVMIDGKWTTDAAASALAYRDGRFERSPSILRHWVTADGGPGPTGDGGFRAEAAVITCSWRSAAPGRTGR